MDREGAVKMGTNRKDTNTGRCREGEVRQEREERAQRGWKEETGDKREETGDRRQETEERGQETGDG